MTLTDAYGNPRRPARFSQCSKLLHLLESGEWWTTRELLREVPCVVHSRIAELRKRGYIIEHETTGAGAAGSRYRLIQTAAEGSPSDPSPSLMPHITPPAAQAATEAPSAADLQLELVA